MLEVSGSSIHVCSFLQRQPTAMPDMQRRHAVDCTTAATRSPADPMHQTSPALHAAADGLELEAGAAAGVAQQERCMALSGMAWRGMARVCTAWHEHGTAWHGHGMAWPRTAGDTTGLACHGLSAMQWHDAYTRGAHLSV